MELSEGPFAQALDVVRRVNFTRSEWTEYERSKMAEQDYYGGLSLARKEGCKEGREEGIAEGKAQSILLVLKARGLAIPEEVRAQLLACKDAARLERWLQRALSAPDAAAVVSQP